MSKTKKRIIWVVIILALISGGYFYLQSKKPKTEYTTAEVIKGNVMQTVSVTGELVSENQVNLAFRSSGEVKKNYVEVGDKIKKGQLIATIDNSSSLIDLSEAKKDLEYQKENLSNMKERDDTYNKDQRDAQRALIAKAELAVEDINRQIKEKSIYSPIDGILIKKELEEGEMATANASIFTVAQEGDLIIESNIPESDITKIALGQKANITFDALTEDKKLEGEVINIEPSSTIVQGVVYYKTKLKLITTDSQLRNGMSADIDIKTAEKENVLMIPLRAVKNENNQRFVDVMVDTEKNITERANIQIGLEGDEGMAEIISGLKEGQKVVTFVKVQ